MEKPDRAVADHQTRFADGNEITLVLRVSEVVRESGVGVAERHPRDCEMTRVIDHRLALAASAACSSGDCSHTQDPRCKKGEDEVTMILGRMGGREERRG